MSARAEAIADPVRLRRSVGVVWLAVSLVLAHLPFAPAAAAAAPGVLCTNPIGAPAETERVAVDDCCAPAPVVIVADACCAPSSGAQAPVDPCCPDGCQHCPRPCCSAPMALIDRGGDVTLPLHAVSQLELPLPDCTSAPADGVFHPPRG